jgi:hypothetical protein
MSRLAFPPKVWKAWKARIAGLSLALLAAGAVAQGGVTVPTLPPEYRAATPGEQRCLDTFRAETTRMERDLARRAPSKHDVPAYQAWSLELHQRLQQAADRAFSVRPARRRRARNVPARRSRPLTAATPAAR